MSGLVLSLFPGIGLLDMAFEEEGFTVVRGPDLLWGGDIHRFHPPAGRFDGVIGGPPCQAFSSANAKARKGLARLAPNLIPEFERCVAEARPRWALMENVRQAPPPDVAKMDMAWAEEHLLNNRWCGGVQNRVRRFTFCSRDFTGIKVRQEALEPAEKAGCVTAHATRWDAAKKRSSSHRSWRGLRRALDLQGLPPSFLDRAPFSVEGAWLVVGNGVPLPLGRAVARAVREAITT